MARAAKHKAATRRAFPYDRAGKLWAEEKTIAEIAKAIGRIGEVMTSFMRSAFS